MKQEFRGHLFPVLLVVSLLGRPAVLPSADCNRNDRDDAQDLAIGASQDCNADGVPDECDIVASFRLASPVDMPVGLNPWGVISGDLDGDADLDLALANQGSSSISVLLNCSDGTFSGLLDLPGVAGPRSVTTGDLNGDARLDLIAAASNADAVAILLGNGDGTFGRPTYFSAGDNPSGSESIVARDLDGDGDLDVAVANEFSNDISVLMNPGEATLSTQMRHAAGLSSSGLVAADLDGDGDQDLAVSNGYYLGPQGSVAILGNQGDGTFAARGTHAVGAEPFSLASGDLDADGDVDLVTRNFRSNNVSVLLNPGDGKMLSAVGYAAGKGPSSIKTADLDGDGHLDLVVGNQDSNDVALLFNRGDATFSLPESYPVGTAGSAPMSVTVGDLNGDAVLDLAMTNRLSHTVSVLFGALSGPFSQDAYANGVPDECELVAFRRGDANADGERDISDAVSILLYLFSESAQLLCLDALDSNDDRRIDISDAVGLLAYLFRDGFPPREPLATCGIDPTPGELGCESYLPCE